MTVEHKHGIGEETEENSERARWIPNVWFPSHGVDVGSIEGNKNCLLAAQLEEDKKNINADFKSSAPRGAALTKYQQLLSASREKFLRPTPWHVGRWLSRDSSTNLYHNQFEHCCFSITIVVSIQTQGIIGWKRMGFLDNDGSLLAA